MELTVLGCGTCSPGPERSGPGFLLREGPRSLLLDLSPGVLDRMAPHVALEALDAVVISHLHLDHSGGLASLLFALNCGVVRARPLVVIGPQGLAERVRGLRELYGHWVREPACGIRWIEWAGAELDIDSWRVDAVPVAHSAAGHGWRVESPSGATLAYSGDTGPCDRLVELVRGADLLLVECTAADGVPLRGHLTPADCGALAVAAGVDRTLLCHLPPGVDGAAAAEEVRRLAGGEVLAARDGLGLRIP